MRLVRPDPGLKVRTPAAKRGLNSSRAEWCCHPDRNPDVRFVCDMRLHVIRNLSARSIPARHVADLPLLHEINREFLPRTDREPVQRWPLAGAATTHAECDGLALRARRSRTAVTEMDSGDRPRAPRNILKIAEIAGNLIIATAALAQSFEPGGEETSLNRGGKNGDDHEADRKCLVPSAPEFLAIGCHDRS